MFQLPGTKANYRRQNRADFPLHHYPTKALAQIPHGRRQDGEPVGDPCVLRPGDLHHQPTGEQARLVAQVGAGNSGETLRTGGTLLVRFFALGDFGYLPYRFPSKTTPS